MTIRRYTASDYVEWGRMRTAFWPDQTEADRANRISQQAHERLGFTEVDRVVPYGNRL